MVFAVGISMSCSRKQEGKVEAAPTSQSDARQDTSKGGSVARLRAIYGEFCTENDPMRLKWTHRDIQKKIESAGQTRDRVDSVCSEAGISQQDSAVCRKFQEALRKHRETLDKISDADNKIAEAEMTAEEHKATDEKLAEEGKQSVFRHWAKENLDSARNRYRDIKSSLICAGARGLHPEECPYYALDRIAELR